MIQRTRHLGEPARRLFVVVGALLALVVAMPGGAQAQDAGGNGPAPEKKDEAARSSPRHPSAGWLPRVRLDNDAYNFWLHPGHRSDEEYTNGVVLGMETLRAPAWGGVLGGGAPACLNAQLGDRVCLSTLLFIGQDMYTPNLDRPPFSYIGWEFERPYAAWLYVGGRGAASRRGRCARTRCRSASPGPPR